MTMTAEQIAAEAWRNNAALSGFSPVTETPSGNAELAVAERQAAVEALQGGAKEWEGSDGHTYSMAGEHLIWTTDISGVSQERIAYDTSDLTKAVASSGLERIPVDAHPQFSVAYSRLAAQGEPCHFEGSVEAGTAYYGALDAIDRWDGKSAPQLQAAIDTAVVAGSGTSRDKEAVYQSVDRAIGDMRNVESRQIAQQATKEPSAGKSALQARADARETRSATIAASTDKDSQRLAAGM